MKKITIDPKSFFKVLGGTSKSQVAEMVLEPNQSTGGSDNRHEQSDQWLYVISGSGKAVVNTKSFEINSGDLILIEAGEKHEIKNTGKQSLKTFNIYAPPEY